MSTTDASGTSSSIRPIVEADTYVDDDSGYAVPACDVMATCKDDGLGCVIFAYDIAATPGHATFTMGASDTPSSVCSPMDAATGYAPLVDAMAALAPLPLASGVTPVGSWRVY